MPYILYCHLLHSFFVVTHIHALTCAHTLSHTQAPYASKHTSLLPTAPVVPHQGPLPTPSIKCLKQQAVAPSAEMPAPTMCQVNVLRVCVSVSFSLFSLSLFFLLNRHLLPDTTQQTHINTHTHQHTQASPSCTVPLHAQAANGGLHSSRQALPLLKRLQVRAAQTPTRKWICCLV